MSGHQVPYQLRTNKFIERQLFLDALDFVRVWNGPSKYVYVSMGGPFLEDFKHINDRFSIESMVSLESDEMTWKRQQFNSPFGFIECRHQTTGAFINDFNVFAGERQGSRFVIWLDYANASERYMQLQEYESLLNKLGEGDIIKITLNANYQSSMKRSEHQSLSDRRFDTILMSELSEELGEYVPSGGIQKAHLSDKGFAQLLMECVQMAAVRATQNSEIISFPLLGCRYKDSEHQMMTATVVLCSDASKAGIMNDTSFAEWPFRSKDWENVIEVKVPHLSAHERSSINHLMKTIDDAYRIHTEIGIQFDENQGESINQLRNYIRHYRRYPFFGRVQ
jgi:hypothetical protein